MPLPDPAAWQAIWLTVKLAAASTVLLVLLVTPLAWWLAHARSRLAGAVQAVAMLPLVLPPTVLGFYLLVLMGPDGWLGTLTQRLGIGLLSFSFTGLLIGSVVFSLPFALMPILRAFETIGRKPLEIACTLGASPLDAFLTVALPLAKPGFLSAAVLTFAHTVGEFGVVLMIGGNIPGQTRTVSTQIYGHVEALEYAQAHALSALMVVFSLAVLLLVGRQSQDRLHRLDRSGTNP